LASGRSPGECRTIGAGCIGGGGIPVAPQAAWALPRGRSNTRRLAGHQPRSECGPMAPRLHRPAKPSAAQRRDAGLPSHRSASVVSPLSAWTVGRHRPHRNDAITSAGRSVSPFLVAGPWWRHRHSSLDETRGTVSASLRVAVYE
jgi:hypothetical protein